MKIAIVTDDGKTISQHFGRATHYSVVEIEEGRILSHELREKPGHHTFQHHSHPAQSHENQAGRGMGEHTADKHAQMISVIQDCSVLLARGMGRGAHISMEQAGILPFQVDFQNIDAALQALMDGQIDQHIYQQLCGEHGHHHE